MNIQLKNVIIVLISLNDNIKKNNEKLKNLLNDYNSLNVSIPNIPVKEAYKEPIHKEIKNKNVEINQNQTGSPKVNVLRTGSGISKNDQQNIINCAINVYKNKQTPISENTAKAVKRVLGGDWLVIPYHIGKPCDFNITMVKGNSYIHFTIENLGFHVIRI